MVRSFSTRLYEAGNTIINEGDHGHEFFIMKSGEAKVLIHGSVICIGHPILYILCVCGVLYVYRQGGRFATNRDIFW